MSAPDWDELVGQDEAIATVRRAAEAALRRRTDARIDGDAPEAAMSHAWLITGPPGSGRSNLAYAFATALLAGDAEGQTRASVAAQVEARSHPDLTVLSTEKVVIAIDEVRTLVSAAQYSPSVSRYRVIVVEDADRMTERSSNVLLKSLEEPPPTTVWILCAPSEADLLPTIRSRSRVLRLTLPEVEEVAELLIRRDGVASELAAQAARHAQSHIGMAHRLATSAEARDRRAETLQLALGLDSVSAAVRGAARLLELAGDDAAAITAERDAQEREDALRSLGVVAGAPVPVALRAQLKHLEEEQKRRATRSLRDGVDRILVDLLSLYRDVLLSQLDAQVPLVNSELGDGIEGLAASWTPEATLGMMDAVATARARIDANVNTTMALEAMLVTGIRRERR